MLQSIQSNPNLSGKLTAVIVLNSFHSRLSHICAQSLILSQNHSTEKSVSCVHSCLSTGHLTGCVLTPCYPTERNAPLLDKTQTPQSHTRCGLTQPASRTRGAEGREQPPRISTTGADLPLSIPLPHKLGVDCLPLTYCVPFLNFLIKCLSPRKFCRKD